MGEKREQRLAGKVFPPDHPDAPKYWMYETGGDLARAVHAYLAGEPLIANQLHLMQLYLYQWVRSPVWRGSGMLEARSAPLPGGRNQKPKGS